MPRENNFRIGRGMIRERRESLSAAGYLAVWAWLHSATMFYYMRAMGARTL
jgi:hypothetical protein